MFAPSHNMFLSRFPCPCFQDQLSCRPEFEQLCRQYLEKRKNIDIFVELQVIFELACACEPSLINIAGAVYRPIGAAMQ
ncbi:MAG: hypothetical protein ABJM29_00255 [Rhizobiaceae bacterium]